MIARIIVIIAAICTLAAASQAEARSTEVDILKLHHGRVYFDAGTERYIFTDHSWLITCGNDTIAGGRIERSFDGLSYGRIDPGTQIVSSDSCRAQIAVARIDTTSTISVGLVESAPLTDWLVLSCDRSDTTGSLSMALDTARSVAVRSFASQLSMVLAFERGEIDGMISSEQPADLAVPFNQRTAAAPYYFALIPNPASRATTDGLLSTSLYYRFDDRRLHDLYDGSAPSLYTGLYWSQRAAMRPYEYSPSTGRHLLARMTSPVRRVGLAYEYDLLRPLAEYFGDLLSRDRIRVALDRELPEPDLRFAAIPLYSERPWQSMEVISHILAQDTSAFSREAELVRQTFERLALVARFYDQPQGRTYLARAEQGLIDDLGVFPLFRPTLFVITSPNIVGVVVTPEGRVDLCNANKLIAPQTEARP